MSGLAIQDKAQESGLWFDPAVFPVATSGTRGMMPPIAAATSTLGALEVWADGINASAATTSVAGAMSAADKTKLDGITAGMTVRAIYIGFVAAGTTATVAHGWGDRPSVLTGWHDNGAGTGLYYYPFSAGVGLAGTTDVVITYCDATNIKVKAGAGIGVYCYVAGIFPRAQQ